jgi:sec-independent protein translocase protein TatB
MFNVGGGEILVILLVALLVVGPAKLPEAARQIGNGLTQLRKMSSGFQNELRAALDDASAPPDTPAATPKPPGAEQLGAGMDEPVATTETGPEGESPIDPPSETVAEDAAADDLSTGG